MTWEDLYLSLKKILIRFDFAGDIAKVQRYWITLGTKVHEVTLP